MKSEEQVRLEKARLQRRIRRIRMIIDGKTRSEDDEFDGSAGERPRAEEEIEFLKRQTDILAWVLKKK